MVTSLPGDVNGTSVDWDRARHRMVDEQIRARGITHDGVIRAMQTVPRHEFVPTEYRGSAYEDRPLPIGWGQTISQPYMVAAMTEALDPVPGDHVLEVGTGSGYQAAVLAHLVSSVHTVEWVPELADRARATLERLGVGNVTVRVGDGSVGLPGRRFEGIIVTAGAPEVPPALVEQLADNGRLVAPCGTRHHQSLTIIRRRNHSLQEERRDGCVFVPLQGVSGWSTA